ncbi:MAG: LemA family protein, partial [Succinivibrio sp.]
FSEKFRQAGRPGLFCVTRPAKFGLIPNLVNTVKGYATHEKETLEQLTQARTNAFRPQQGAVPSAEDMKKFEESQGAIGAALGRLIAISENYPDLKANQNFLELQAQLEGTENRIAVARKDFNDSVNSFNQSVRRFPKNFLARMFGFETKAYLEAEDSAKQNPKVSF